MPTITTTQASAGLDGLNGDEEHGGSDGAQLGGNQIDQQGNGKNEPEPGGT
jgi:hypothetical protein